MTNPLKQAIEELKKEENLKKKKKKSLEFRKEKRLNYYSKWYKDDSPVNKEKEERQKKLC